MPDHAVSSNRILFADPDVVLCVSARRALQRAGFAVTLVHNGPDAIDRLAAESYDVIVSGAELPRRSGIQVLREARRLNASLPVILYGETPSELGWLAVQEGAFAFLPTPAASFTELIDTIDRALTDQPKLAAKAASAEPSSGDEGRVLVAIHDLIESTRRDDLLDTVQNLLEMSANLLHAEHAVFLLVDDEGRLQIHNALGFADQAAATRDLTTHVGDAFAWGVAKERQTLTDHSLAVEDQVRFRVIGTPIVVGKEVLGVLVVYPLDEQPIEPARLAWFETFAAQGAIAVKMARLQDENHRLHPSDPVTGALKLNIFLDLADHEFRRSWRYNQPISLVVVDVDGMQDINSMCGREFGDHVLREVAASCRQTVRLVDLVGRHGEDSFALLLVMTDRAGAKSAAERVRTGIASLDLSGPYGAVRVSVSLGVCTYPRADCASIYDLLKVAQDAQRFARRGGTNQLIQA